MTRKTPDELAMQPAGDDQIARARELAGDDPQLNAQIDRLLRLQPTRGQMNEHLAALRPGSDERRLDAAAKKLCAALGNTDPTTAEKLLALQVQMLHEQSTMLGKMTRQMRADSKVLQAIADAPDGTVNAILAGLVAGAIAST